MVERLAPRKNPHETDRVNSVPCEHNRSYFISVPPNEVVVDGVPMIEVFDRKTINRLVAEKEYWQKHGNPQATKITLNDIIKAHG